MSGILSKLAGLCQETIDNCLPINRIVSTNNATQQIQDVRSSELTKYDHYGTSENAMLSKLQPSEEEAGLMAEEGRTSQQKRSGGANSVAAARDNGKSRGIGSMDEDQIVNKKLLEREQENFFADVDLNETNGIEFNSAVKKPVQAPGIQTNATNKSTINQNAAQSSSQRPSSVSDQQRQDETAETSLISLAEPVQEQNSNSQSGWLSMDDNDLQL